MAEIEGIRLVRLAQATGMPHRTLRRWLVAGLIRGADYGTGRGRGGRFTKDEAIEACALILLRRAGVPLQRLESLARDLRRAGKAGPDFFAAGSAGRRPLLDGAGDAAPLRDPKTGQTFLPLAFDTDLRRVRADALRLVAALEVEERARAQRKPRAARTA